LKTSIKKKKKIYILYINKRAMIHL